MIRPHINITLENGEMHTIYPPLQWNDGVTSQRKILEDCKVWMHMNHPTWESATINLKHFNYVESIDVKRK